jgi:hypothetical protein
MGGPLGIENPYWLGTVQGHMGGPLGTENPYWLGTVQGHTGGSLGTEKPYSVQGHMGGPLGTQTEKPYWLVQGYITSPHLPSLTVFSTLTRPGQSCYMIIQAKSICPDGCTPVT